MARRPAPPDGFADELVSDRKRRAILTSATEVFLAQGYLGTSMDEIASGAGVSKQTVYKHFTDKERLFVAIVTTTVDEVSDPVYEEVLRLADSGDVEADLRDLARRQLQRVMEPRLLALRRLLIGEAMRFPELGEAFYARGPGRTIAALADAFARLAERGVLVLPDPGLAAAQFNWLVMAASINEAMLRGPRAAPSRSELRRRADAGVTTFLAAHRPGGRR